MTTYTSASVVLLRDSYRTLDSVRTNLALLIAMDWMERDLLDQAHRQLNDLMQTVADIKVHREKGAKAQ